MRHGKLRHGLRGGAGCVLHGDAIFLGIGDVDVVHAHAAADDELEAAALGLVDVVGAHLGLGAHHGHVEVPKGFAQLVGLIKLLHHLVAFLPEGGHGGFVHTVGDKNPHDYFSFPCSRSNWVRHSTSASTPA